VWINAELPEAAAARVHPGMPVEVRTAAQPEVAYKGRVGALLPEINAQTRTIKARIEVANPSGQLVPGLFASVAFVPADTPEVTVVPSEAIIATGRRTVVFVAEGDGKFRAVDVTLGAEGNGMTQIRSGIEPGQDVVVSGQFLLDSDASLKGASTRLADANPALPIAANGAAANAPAGEHRTTGRVEAVAADMIMLSHDPVPTLKWGAMTMGFAPPATGWPAAIKVGDRVAFTFRVKAAGEYELIAVTPAPASSPIAAAPVAAPGVTPAADPHAAHRAPAGAAK
jgi:Cu(I)/Ag(I) efflux system membrane fusion protein